MSRLLFNGPNLLWNGDSLNPKLLYGAPCVEPANAVACVRSDAVTRVVFGGSSSASMQQGFGAGGPFNGAASMTFSVDLLINAQANSTLLAPNGPADCRFMWTHFFPGLFISDNVVDTDSSFVAIDPNSGTGANMPGSGVMVRYRHRCGDYFEDFPGQSPRPTRVYEIIEAIAWFDLRNDAASINQGGPATRQISFALTGLLSQDGAVVNELKFVGLLDGLGPSIGPQMITQGGVSIGTTPGVGPFANSALVVTGMAGPSAETGSGSFSSMTSHVDSMVTCADALCAFTQTPAPPAGSAPPPPLDDPAVISG